MLLYLLYRAFGRNEGELSVEAGQTIQVLARPENGWWIGETISGERGIFPSWVLDLARALLLPDFVL